jgi:hypothetical protein
VDSVLHDTKTQKNAICLLAHSAHEIILGESRYNFGCGYTYGTRFGHNLTGTPGKLNAVPEWRFGKKQNHARRAILAYGWTGQQPGSGFFDLAPSILHYNWF